MPATALMIGAAIIRSTATVRTVDSADSLPPPAITVYRPVAVSAVCPLKRMSLSGEESSEKPERRDGPKALTGSSGVSGGAESECWRTRPSAPMIWTATTRWSVVSSEPSNSAAVSKLRAATMSRTRPAAASSTLESRVRYNTKTRPPPATSTATKTTAADSTAERVEMPQLAGRISEP
jgi:hypothetical protein